MTSRVDRHKSSWENLTIFQVGTIVVERHFPERGFFDDSHDTISFVILLTDFKQID